MKTYITCRRDMITILEASIAGAETQKRKLGTSQWEDQNGAGWDFARYDYRIKPKPREWTVKMSDDGTYIESPRHPTDFPSIYTYIKVREVIE